MGRLLFLALVIGVTIFLLRKLYLGKNSQSENTGKSSQAQLMKKCQHCELHLPENQGVQDEQGRFFCNTEHLKAFEQQ